MCPNSPGITTKDATKTLPSKYAKVSYGFPGARELLNKTGDI